MTPDELERYSPDEYVGQDEADARADDALEEEYWASKEESERSNNDS